MLSEHSSDVKFEIGHVLFIDIVGYSKLLINEQSEQIQKLKEIVRGTEQFKKAESEGKLLRLPTGDGGALVFRTSAEAPVLCALEISRGLKEHPELRVRMGIHSGPVNEITDLNGQANIAGAGINIAQRVMGCGDAGHILLSKHVADDLEHYPRWKPYLHELGECEVKHHVRIGVVNLYNNELGNPKTPKRLQSVQRRRARTRWGAIVTGLLSLGVIVAAFVIVSKKSARLTLTAPEKSIAVLPFENRSEDKANTYFADGIQDEILTRLSKIADLKVISRTSTQHFKSSPDNLPQIAKQLGVMHVLEGSVQKSNDQVRVNVQLINALTDAHLWAETFDRKLTDIFAVESEIAKSVAENLKARLNGRAEEVLAARPTENPEAHELYLKGRYLWNRRNTASLRKAGDYFQQAIDLDPNYALAYAGLADVHSLLPIYAGTPPKDDVSKALAAARKAVELDSNLAEAHTSLGNALVMNVQYKLAEQEFRRALELNPNYATAHQWLAECLFSQGRFLESLAESERAHELDPLSLIINASYASSLSGVGRYDDAVKQAHKTIDLDPDLVPGHAILGQIYEDRGKLDEAIAEYRKANALEATPANFAMLAYAYAKTGRLAEARKILDKLTDLSAQRYVGAYPLAIVHLALGEKEEALRLLEKSFAERDFLLQGLFGSIKMDKRLDPLRNDPRFQKLVERFDAGIPE
jgi:TolB-like protein/Flp pilus assembly protein TadD